MAGGEVVWHVTMSVDGFITGPDDAMDWALGYEASPLGRQVMESTGAILAGRRWYDVATDRYDGVEGIYGGAWTGPVFVLTHRPAGVQDASVTFLSDRVEEAVRTARAAAGDKNLEIFGADTARQCLKAGLVDEIVIHLAPVLLGDGVRLYGGGRGAGSVDLERIDVAESGQLTDLRFRVVR
jgi:dihydrofolate reductase